MYVKRNMIMEEIVCVLKNKQKSKLRGLLEMYSGPLKLCFPQ